MRSKLRDEFDAVAFELARAAGWVTPSGGVFLDGDLDSLWLSARRANADDPIAALRAFPVWRGPQDVRLPGDVGAVRDLEVPHPSFELPKASGDDFTLTGGDVETGRKQGSLF